MCLSVTDRESVDCADLFPDGEHIEQGLCGMLSNPVSGVDHGLPTVSGGHLQPNNRLISLHQSLKSAGNRCRKYAL